MSPRSTRRRGWPRSRGPSAWRPTPTGARGRADAGPRRAGHVGPADPAARPGRAGRSGRAPSGWSASSRPGWSPSSSATRCCPVVGWSWLTEALEGAGAEYVGAGRHRHPDVVGAVRRHRRAAPGRRRRAARVLDAGGQLTSTGTPRRSAAGRFGRRAAAGWRTSARSIVRTDHRAVTCALHRSAVISLRHPVGWIEYRQGCNFHPDKFRSDTRR